mmetsp:Transcript_33800/g.76432  ORF Transcript_33800/g.76432 Transcript_33800/m.76432 type:complete len:325 (+) Transcript_33800:2532-3506(+)
MGEPLHRTHHPNPQGVDFEHFVSGHFGGWVRGHHQGQGRGKHGRAASRRHRLHPVHLRLLGGPCLVERVQLQRDGLGDDARGRGGAGVFGLLQQLVPQPRAPRLLLPPRLRYRRLGHSRRDRIPQPLQPRIRDAVRGLLLGVREHPFVEHGGGECGGGGERASQVRLPCLGGLRGTRDAHRGDPGAHGQALRFDAHEHGLHRDLDRGQPGLLHQRPQRAGEAGPLGSPAHERNHLRPHGRLVPPGRHGDRDDHVPEHVHIEHQGCAGLGETQAHALHGPRLHPRHDPHQPETPGPAGGAVHGPAAHAGGALRRAAGELLRLHDL